MMYSFTNGRNQRSRNQIFNPIHQPFANYCTESLQKSEMKFDYDNEIFLNNLHLIPDPLMKNLADTLITAEKAEKPKKQSLETPKMPSKLPSTEDVRVESTLAGITNFISGVFNMLSGAMFGSRSPVHHSDCFDAEPRQGSPQTWRDANDQDKNGLDKLSDESKPNGVPSNMNNCESVISCEEKLNQVRCLLSKPTKKSNPIWRKRPKKVFVEPGSVEDSFEDAFSPEDFVSLPNTPYLEYQSPPQHQTEDLCETEAAKTKTKVAPVKETTEIIKEVKESGTTAQNNTCDPKSDNIILNVASKNIEENADDKQQLVSSCEDKLSKLKALLQAKRTKNTKVMNPTPETTTEQPRPAKTIPISKPIDKHYKNPHRMLDKRQKMKMKRSIQDDVIFANEIDIESPTNSPSTPSTVNSSETSLGEYFDELKGRFRSASTTESEDSFQIVFNDSPKHNRKASDCESEDSFIVFEDTDCYTSNDVFGESDSDSDVSDSGCSTMTCKLSHSLSRTVSNLTDDTLYESSDEVDCAKVEPVGAKGLLMDADKRSQRKDQPAKKVHFSEHPPTVRVMRVWAYAARQARAGHWERFALDRERFKRRIADVDMAVSWVLKPQHRSRVMFQRFMPMWNRQRRQELAEKKEKEAEDKRIEAVRKEEERVEQERLEEERIEEERKREIIEEERKEDIVEESRTVNNATVNINKERKREIIEEERKEDIVEETHTVNNTSVNTSGFNKENDMKSVEKNLNSTQASDGVSETKYEHTQGEEKRHDDRMGQVDSSKSRTNETETKLSDLKNKDGIRNGEIVSKNISQSKNIKRTKDITKNAKDNLVNCKTKCSNLEILKSNINKSIKNEENSQSTIRDVTDKLSADESSKSAQPTSGLGKECRRTGIVNKKH